MSRTVVGGPVEMSLAINDICDYDLSAAFVNAAGAACRIAAGSLRIVNNRINLEVAPNSCPTTGTRQVITIRTDSVAGTYTVSWQTRDRCNPSVGPTSTDGASGSMSRTVVGGPVEMSLAINDICDYDLSAAFVNAAGAACRIAAGSLRIVNNRINLEVAPNSCPTTGTRQVITIRTDSVAGTYTVSWQTRDRCNPSVGPTSTDGASGSMSRTVVGGPVEMSLAINDICDYDLSAAFVNAAGAACRIAAGSLRIVNNRINLEVAPNSCPTTGTRQVITIRTDSVAGTYTVSWQTRDRCNPSVGPTSTDGASGSMSRTVVGGPVEMSLAINDICDYDLSAAFVNAAGAACRIAAGSLRIVNNRINLEVAPNSCPTTGTRQVITIRTDSVAGTYTVSWQTRDRCNPSVGPTSTDGASGSMSRTVVGGPVEMSLAINDICDYDLSAAFVNAAGAACRIAAGSLRIVNNRINLEVAPNSCPTTGTVDEPIDEGLPPAMGDSDGSSDPSQATRPSAVRNLQLTLSDGDSIVVTWDLPADSGGSPITGYLARVSRPGWEDTYSPENRAFTLNGQYNTSYTVSVLARNSVGGGPAVTKQITTDVAPSTPPRVEPQNPNLTVTVTGYQLSSYGQSIYWTPVPGATSYDIGARGVPNNLENIRNGIGCHATSAECGYLFRRDSTTSSEFQNASSFRIRAVNDEGTGEWSNWIPVPADPNTVPSTVEPVSYTLISYFSFAVIPTVIWSRTSNAIDYDVELVGPDRRIIRRASQCCRLIYPDTRVTHARVRARNTAGAGPWSKVAPFDHPLVSVSGIATDDGDLKWSRLLGATAYELEWIYSKYLDGRDDESSRIVTTVDSCCRTPIPLTRTFGKTSAVRIRATNPGREGPWSDSITIANDLQLQDVSYTVGAPLIQSRHQFTKDTVTWTPVIGATSYDIAWEYKRWNYVKQFLESDYKGSDVSIKANCGVERCEYNFLRTADFRQFHFQVRARRGSDGTRYSPAAVIFEPVCPSNSVAKYSLDANRLSARTTFYTVTGIRVSQGSLGGQVDDRKNLPGPGCAWISPSARVSDNADVRDNAFVDGEASLTTGANVRSNSYVGGTAEIRDNANVYGTAYVGGSAKLNDFATVDGNAYVSGEAELNDNVKVYNAGRVFGEAELHNTARVYDEAEVYGEAKLYNNAHVAGNAKVYGKAEIRDDAYVYGYATVFGENTVLRGDVRVSGDAIVADDSVLHCRNGYVTSTKLNRSLASWEVVDSCIFDGKREYEQEADDYLVLYIRDVYRRSYECQKIVSRNDSEESVRSKARDTTVRLLVDKDVITGLLKDNRCPQLIAIKTIIERLTPTPVELALSWAIPMAKGVSLPRNLQLIVEAVNTMNEIRDLASSGRALIKARAEIIKEEGSLGDLSEEDVSGIAAAKLSLAIEKRVGGPDPDDGGLEDEDIDDAIRGIQL